MRNWHPFLAETLTAMADRGITRAIGVLAAAQRSYSGCTQYRENVRDARTSLIAAGRRAPEITYVGDWHEHPGFVTANAEHVRRACDRLPADLRASARLIFTAHSIPAAMAERYPYEAQLKASAARIAQAAARPDWALVYQSRSGRPEDPWLEPDICDYLRREHAAGLRAAVLCPVGFLCDHVEVLYDLDVEAAGVCAELGIAMCRAEAVNAHPAFIGALADAVSETYERYRDGRPLPVIA
jgi:ferrochelatase